MSGPSLRDKFEVMHDLAERHTLTGLAEVIRCYRVAFGSSREAAAVIEDFELRGYRWRRTTDGNPHITYYKEGARDFVNDTLIILNIEDSEIEMFVQQAKQGVNDASRTRAGHERSSGHRRTRGQRPGR